MDFAFTDEQAMIAETAQAFFADNATSERTRKAMAADGIDRDLWNGFCQELGLAGVALPEEYGGADLGQVEFAVLAEAAGGRVAALPLLSLASAARAIMVGGSEAQKAAWLPKLISGEAIGAYGETDAASLKDGLLTGTFKFVPHGGIATVFVLVSGEQAWLVDAKASGVTITPHTTMDQTRPMATITVDGAAAESLALGAAKAAKEGAWMCLAAEALGGAQACLDQTIAYSLDRVQFGRQIGSFQAYKHRLADMAIEIEQARSAVYWAAASLDENTSNKALALHSAKSFAADSFFMCASNMIQLHGGIGFTWEHDAHLYFKRARSVQTMAGSGAWHREQVASFVLEAAE